MTDGLPSLAEGEVRELIGLIGQERDQSLDEQQQPRMAKLVEGHGDGYSLYFRISRLDADLHWYYAPQGETARQYVASFLAEICSAAMVGDDTAASDTVISAAAAVPESSISCDLSSGRPPVLGFVGSALSAATGFLTNPLSAKSLAIVVASSLVTYFVALAISVVLTRIPSVQPNRSDSSPTVVAPAGSAKIVGMTDCQWRQDSFVPKVGVPLVLDRLNLLSGIVELEFACGAHVRVAGPAEFVPQSVARIELARGRLTAYVPQRGRGFQVETPAAELVDLGTEFDVEVDDQGQTELLVSQGVVEVKPTSQQPTADRQSERVSAGQAVRVSAERAAPERITPHPARFDALHAAPMAAVDGTTSPVRDFADGAPIWLGNLFDDPPRTALAKAVRTDALAATPDAIRGLAIECVIDSENRPGLPAVDSAIAPPVGVVRIPPEQLVNLSNLGWRYGLRAQIANDVHAVYETLPVSAGISTRGVAVPNDAPKMEEGIGMHADSLVCFNLDDIREAGHLEGRNLVFLCDRAGVNDDQTGNPLQASLHMAVLVSDRAGKIRSAAANGRLVDMALRNGIWSITNPPPKPLKADGTFVSFRMDLPADVAYLTLITTNAGDGHEMDHAVWSGARLEVQP